MNSRIRALAISSSIYDCVIDPYDKHNTGDPHGSVLDDLEKFAQLIAAECADLCKTVGSDSVTNANIDYNNGRQMGTEVCYNTIRKHFGDE